MPKKLEQKDTALKDLQKLRLMLCEINDMQTRHLPAGSVGLFLTDVASSLGESIVAITPYFSKG